MPSSPWHHRPVVNMSTAHRPTWAPAKGGDNDAQAGSRSWAPSTFFRARDQLGQTKLKFRCALHGLQATCSFCCCAQCKVLTQIWCLCRQPGQGTKEDLSKKDLQVCSLKSAEQAAVRQSVFTAWHPVCCLQEELQEKEQTHFFKKGGDNFFEGLCCVLHDAAPCANASKIAVCFCSVPSKRPGDFTASVAYLPADVSLKCTLCNSPADHAALKLRASLSHQGLELGSSPHQRECIHLIALDSSGVKHADKNCRPP